MSTFGERWQKEKFGTEEKKPEPPEKKRLSADEIEQVLHEIAADPNAGLDRFRAIKMLRGQSEAEEVSLLPEDELMDFIIMMNRSVGYQFVQIAYKRAFPNHKAVDFAEPKIDDSMLSKEALARVKRCNSLKKLYRLYPETKRPGFPPGYPVGRSLETTTAWLQRKAMQIEVDREQAMIDPMPEGIEPRTDEKETGTEVESPDRPEGEASPAGPLLP